MINIISAKKIYTNMPAKIISAEKLATWEVAVDFTKIKNDGIELEELLSRL